MEAPMKDITIAIDDDLLRKACQYADERETTLEALIVEHLGVLADRAGRRLTAREQIHVDCVPSEEIKEALREDFARERQKAR
jgi:hypothetical protein